MVHYHKISDFLRTKNKLRKVKTDVAKLEIKRQSKAYKKVINKARKIYNKQFISTLREMKNKKPKEYWDILNKATNQKDKIGNIAMEAFTQHLKKLSQKDFVDNPIDSRPNNSFDPREINHSINEDINKHFTISEI